MVGWPCSLLVELIAAKEGLQAWPSRTRVCGEREIQNVLDSGIGTKALESDHPGFKFPANHNQLCDLGQAAGLLSHSG